MNRALEKYRAIDREVWNELEEFERSLGGVDLVGSRR